MKVPAETPKGFGNENIVPMINIIFLLLIFFLLSGTLSQRPPFEVDPVATTLQPPAEVPSDGLFVSAQGDLFFRGQIISLAALPNVAVGNNDTLEVLVDRRLPGRTLFPILEALAKSGYQKIQIVTERSGAG